MKNTETSQEATLNKTQETSTETKATDTATTQSASQTKTEENWEYNGDRNNVPEPFKKYATGFDRYLSRKDQALAEYKNKLSEYEKLVNSEEFKSFQQSKSGKQEIGPERQTEELVTQDEADAIALGDTKTLNAVIDRAVNQRLEARITPIVGREREREAQESIKEFSAVHPDFLDLLESPAGSFMIQAAKTGANLEDIYKTAKEAQSWFEAKTAERQKAEFEKKQNGSVAKGTISGKSDVVYVDSEDQAKRMAIELALKKDPRKVEIRRK